MLRRRDPRTDLLGNFDMALDSLFLDTIVKKIIDILKGRI